MKQLTRKCTKNGYLFKYFDLFGIPIQLNFDEKRRYRSYVGAFFSLILFSLSMSLLIFQLVKWYNMSTSTVIYSTENFSINNIFAENRNMTYELNYSNYNIYFAIYAILPDLTSLNFKELANYIDIQIKYSESGYGVDFKKLDYENCKFRRQRIFLDLPYENIFENETSVWSMCLVNPLKMGLFMNKKIFDIQDPTLMLQIKQCQNTTLNNNSCSSKEEIEKMLKYINIQITIPKTNYDFKNQSNPVKRLYLYEDYRPDFKFQKTITNQINPSILYSDWGLIDDDYKLNSINFNPGQQILDIYTKDEQDNIFFEYKINLSYQIDRYYIRNQKLNDIIGSFGGLVNLFFVLGAFICARLNRLLMLNSLINFSFEKTAIVKERGKIHSKSEST